MTFVQKILIVGFVAAIPALASHNSLHSFPELCDNPSNLSTLMDGYLDEIADCYDADSDLSLNRTELGFMIQGKICGG